MIEDLSVAKRKQIAALRLPKHRKEAGLFVAEGTKCIAELSSCHQCELIVATSAWLESHKDQITSEHLYKASRADLERISSLSTAPEAIAVFRIPQRGLIDDDLNNRLVVAIDGVQDPGNLGTIIRCCDWFGISTIICSRDTVDLYNPKVIQATMGAIGRVKVVTVDLPEFLSGVNLPIYGTFLDGKCIYDAQLSNRGIIVMGNEGRGISPEVANIVTNRLLIPPYYPDAPHVESLNVSMATAITLAEFRRRS